MKLIFAKHSNYSKDLILHENMVTWGIITVEWCSEKIEGGDLSMSTEWKLFGYSWAILDDE